MATLSEKSHQEASEEEVMNTPEFWEIETMVNYEKLVRIKYALKIHSIIEELMNKDWSKVNNNIK